MATFLKKRRTTCNFIQWAAILLAYLERHKVCFKHDIPVIPAEMIVTNVPQGLRMVPLRKRRKIRHKENFILCCFEDDIELYKAVRAIIKALQTSDEMLQEELASYRGYVAVAGFDLSIFFGVDRCEQDMFLLLNQMLTAVLATNGIRIIPNFRIGDLEQVNVFACFPRGVCYAVGRLGGVKNASSLDDLFMWVRIICARPSKLLVYGYSAKPGIPLLEELGTPYECFEDYRHWVHNAKKGGTQYGQY